ISTHTGTPSRFFNRILNGSTCKCLLNLNTSLAASKSFENTKLKRDIPATSLCGIRTKPQKYMLANIIRPFGWIKIRPLSGGRIAKVYPLCWNRGQLDTSYFARNHATPKNDRCAEMFKHVEFGRLSLAASERPYFFVSSSDTPLRGGFLSPTLKSSGS